MKDLISIEAKRRSYTCTLASVDKEEKEALDEVEFFSIPCYTISS